jgi:hypothetical protein
LLYLFSSNIRPLYIQDILDVLAAPRRARYQFRYAQNYVDPDLMKATITGEEAVVHFSIQQEAQYHAPAFIPIRRAKVVDAGLRADIYVVTFEVTDYIALTREENEHPSAPVTRYAAALAQAHIKRPYGPSASLAPDLRDTAREVFDPDSDEANAFASTAKLLQRTEWFRGARFVRVTALREGPTNGPEVASSDGTYVLTAGSTYAIELTHYEPGEVTDRQTFTISADDDVVQVIGKPGFDIASKYDYIRVFLHASLPARDEPRETVVTIEPSPGVQGPTVRLPVRVIAPRGRTAALAAASAIILLLFGLPAVFTTWPQGWKFALVFIGAIALSLVQSYGVPLSIPSGFGLTSHANREANAGAAAGGGKAE